MTILYSKGFKKRLKLLPSKIQAQTDARLRLFAADPTNPLLRQHPLKGGLKGYFSINISGDMRAVFRRDGDAITFVLIGTHSQLYG